MKRKSRELIELIRFEEFYSAVAFYQPEGGENKR